MRNALAYCAEQNCLAEAFLLATDRQLEAVCRLAGLAGTGQSWKFQIAETKAHQATNECARTTRAYDLHRVKHGC